MKNIFIKKMKMGLGAFLMMMKISGAFKVFQKLIIMK